MFILFCVSILAAAITVSVWIWTRSPMERVALILAAAMKSGILGLVLRRPTIQKLTLSNGCTLLMPRKFLKHSIDAALELKIRPDDVIVASYIKAGTTWMQSIVWLICNDADTAAAKRDNVSSRYGFLEALDEQGFGKGVQSLKRWPKGKRRFIKTHMPVQLLPNELQNKPVCKTIYVARNPKDCCVSYYYFHLMNISGLPHPGTWSEFVDKFCRGDVTYGSWFEHVKNYWQLYQERRDSIYFTTYENLKKDLKGEITKIAKFLDQNLSEEKVDSVVQHCTFKAMSEDSASNQSNCHDHGVMDFKISKFIRKGQVGDWKNHFTINQNIAFDEMYKERTKDWTLKLEFEPTK